jgi:hypothetical protein
MPAVRASTMPKPQKSRLPTERFAIEKLFIYLPRLIFPLTQFLFC